MKIKIYDDAQDRYVRKAALTGIVNWDWAEKLAQIEGQIIEVDTKYLFKDQYNTVPIPGVSATGLRIMDESVEEVIDDERPGKGRCYYCGRTVEAVDNPDEAKCKYCSKVGYIENFDIRRK